MLMNFGLELEQKLNVVNKKLEFSSTAYLKLEYAFFSISYFFLKTVDI